MTCLLMYVCRASSHCHRAQSAQSLWTFTADTAWYDSCYVWSHLRTVSYKAPLHNMSG